MKFFYRLFRLEEPVNETVEILKAELEEHRIHLHDLQSKPCEACEVLKIELENERFEKRRLLDKLLFPPEPKPEPQFEEIKPHLPRHTPWAIKAAILEKEDREKARIMAELAERNKPSPVTTVAKLEEELLTAPDKTAASGGQVFEEIAPITEQDLEDATGT